MPWVQVGIAAVGAISSLIGGSKAEKAAKRQAREEARLEGIVTGEKLRKLRIEEQITKGQTIAAGAASGVDVRRGSVAMILAEQQREFTRERHITEQVGASRAANIRQQGAAIGAQARYQGISGVFQSFQGVNWGGLKSGGN
jgi:hypothetical protein